MLVRSLPWQFSSGIQVYDPYSTAFIRCNLLHVKGQAIAGSMQRIPFLFIVHVVCVV